MTSLPRIVRFTLTPALLLGLAACGPRKSTETSPPPAQQQTFTVQGFLRSIDFAGQTVRVEHEEIPNFMPAMTMPFDVKTMAEVEPLKAGDAIEFQMIVTDDSSWIEGVKKIAPSEIQLPERKPARSAGIGNVARLKEGDPLPEFQLMDSKGRQVSRETFAGKPVLLTFIFTRCPIPNFCPLMMENFSAIQKALADDTSRAEQVQYLSISFDSEFDTPEVLAEYAARHTEDTDRWRFASGSAEQIQQLTQAFSLQVQPESGTISHSLATALIGPDGVIRQIWRGNGWKPEEVIEALRGL